MVDKIQLGMECGDITIRNQIIPTVIKLRKLLNRKQVVYSDQLNNLGFNLRVDGRHKSFNLVGCDKPQLNLKRGNIGIDIGLSGVISNLEKKELKEKISEFIKEASSLIIEELQINKVDFLREAFRENVELALKDFQNKD